MLLDQYISWNNLLIFLNNPHTYQVLFALKFGKNRNIVNIKNNSFINSKTKLILLITENANYEFVILLPKCKYQICLMNEIKVLQKERVLIIKLLIE